MEDSNQEYLKLLNKKLESLTNMLKATELETFTGEGDEEQIEAEADRFSGLYEQRANMIKIIERTDKTMASIKIKNNDKAFIKARQEITDKIKETAKAMVELDKKNVEASIKLTDFLRGNVKKMREGRGVSEAYTEFGSSSGHFYDSKYDTRY
jgi:endonuclease III